MADEPVTVTAERVSRPRRPWSDTTHRLLAHLGAAGIEGLPAPLPPTSPDTEDTTFVPGESLVAAVFDADQVASLARLLRAVHDAGVDVVRTGSEVWQPFEFRAEEPRPVDGAPFLGDLVIGHGDTGPWNVIATSAATVSLIDWEFAGPIVRVDEIAATCWLDLRFHDPEVDVASGATDLAAKAGLLAVFLRAYGVPRDGWAAVVRGMVDYAIRDAAYEATRLEVAPDTVPADDSVEWRLAWRSRSAAWIVRNQRQILELADAHAAD